MHIMLVWTVRPPIRPNLIMDLGHYASIGHYPCGPCSSKCSKSYIMTYCNTALCTHETVTNRYMLQYVPRWQQFTSNQAYSYNHMSPFLYISKLFIRIYWAYLVPRTTTPQSCLSVRGGPGSCRSSSRFEEEREHFLETLSQLTALQSR